MVLAQGNLAKGMGSLKVLLNKYRELGLRHFEPGVLFLRARIELALGEREKAYRTLTKAVNLADEFGIHRETWEMYSVLSQLF